jgi:hypothetical protein
MPFRWLTIFLDFPGQDFGPGVAFWREVTGSGLSPYRGPAGEFATLLPAQGDAYLRVQRISEGNGGCHLDLHVDPGAGSLEDAAARATMLGACLRRRDDDLIVADSPGGFTFCFVPWEGETAVPGPVHLGGGGTSRADQLCLDIPPDAFERECSFWAALSSWDLRPGALPEFAYLARSGGCRPGSCSSDAGKPAPGTACPLTSTSPARTPSAWPNGTWRWAVSSARCFLPGWRWPTQPDASTV